jgi:3-oxoacyl-[acyl-carrier-protein] synthase III
VINLVDAMDDGSLKSGDRALLVTAGLGAGWGSLIVRIA